MKFDSELKPHCQITYAALRAAFVTTLDSLLRYSLDPSSSRQRPSELFDCFPSLSGTAPQIQLECLLRTWERWSQHQAGEPDLLDDCVFFAAYETLARIASERQEKTLAVVLNGPKAMPSPADHWIASKSRCLQLVSSNPLKSRYLRNLGRMENSALCLGSTSADESESAEEDLGDLVGRWAARREVVVGSKGLLTENEQDILRAFFEEHQGLVR